MTLGSPAWKPHATLALVTTSSRAPSPSGPLASSPTSALRSMTGTSPVSPPGAAMPRPRDRRSAEADDAGARDLVVPCLASAVPQRRERIEDEENETEVGGDEDESTQRGPVRPQPAPPVSMSRTAIPSAIFPTVWPRRPPSRKEKYPRLTTRLTPIASQTCGPMTAGPRSRRSRPRSPAITLMMIELGTARITRSRRKATTRCHQSAIGRPRASTGPVGRWRRYPVGQRRRSATPLGTTGGY